MNGVAELTSKRRLNARWINGTIGAMDALAVISKVELEKLRAYDGKKPALGAKIDLDQHTAKKLLQEPGALFLVTVGPKNRLWLVAMLYALERGTKGWAPHPNQTPVVDLGPLAKYLGEIEPRLLTPYESEILRHVVGDANAAFMKRKPYLANVPKWKLEPPKPAKKTVTIPPLPNPKLPKRMQLVAQLCAAQLDEVAPELASSSKKLLAKRNAFTETVQSVFEGADDDERLLREELAPWKKAGSVDAAAKRAIEDLCRGIVALAQGRIEDIPKACATYRPVLDAYAPWMKKLLE